MTLRRFAFAPLLALAIFACTPSVPSNPNTVIVTAEFDPSTSTIPLPNDLAINPLLNPFLLHPRNAQEELLGYFFSQHGFPADQVLPLGFPVTIQTVNGPNDVTFTAPTIDLATVVPCTGQQAPGNCNFFLFDATAPADEQFPSYVVTYPPPPVGAKSGSLVATARNAAGKPTTWRPGAQFFYALRGGASGIKTTTGVPLQPSSTTYTLLFGGPGDFVCSSTVPPADCALTQLKALQTNYLPVFATIQNKGFPLTDTVVVGTFAVAPATTWVIADPGTGTVPLPSNFLLDPATNKVSTAVDALFFGLPFSSLDGFSTTGMDIAQTSGPISASSVRSSTGKGVYFYKVGATVATEVTTVYIEPPPITVDFTTGKPCVPVNAQGDFGPTCVSTVIGIQPALPLPTPFGPVALPPLEEKTEYAVLITKKVTDPSGIPLSNTTLGQMLLFTHPLCTPAGCAASPSTAVSEIPGVSGAQAAGLEDMRLRLQPAVAQLATDHNVAKADIAMPYNFRTQSITFDALQLGAGPYAKLPTGADAFPDAPYFNPAVPLDPLNPKPVAPAAMAAKWGLAAVPFAAGISTFVEANVITFDKLDPAWGGFNPVPAAGTITPLPTIIAIPQGAAPAAGYPLVVFHHGLGRSRGDALLIAGVLAGNGMVVAAIDAAKHGARAWCTVDLANPAAPTGCATGVTCNTSVFGPQGDPSTGKPGLCVGALAPKPLDSACLYPGCWDGTGGNSYTSGSFFTTVNFFRWRDTARQDILDQSMLVRVLTTANGSAVLSAAAGAPVAIDPSRVFYVGQSLGSIEGTVDLAANPRVSRAVLNVGGATWVDIMTTSTSPELRNLYLGALAALGITPGSPENLLLLTAAHWVLDPADPANFAVHLFQSPLLNLLASPPAPQAPKAILGQGARCDGTVPNGTNELLYGLIGLAPLEPTATSSTPGMQWFMNSASGTCPTDGSVGPGATHGFLLDWTNPALAATAQANAARYLLGVSVDPTPVVVP